MWTHLSRMKMGVGMRGPGEKQLEVDRRLVEKRIHDLRIELDKIEQRRERQVAARDDHMTVSLVGYTNAGKSTLMNHLTEAGVYQADQLFATLDTRTRRWHLPNWGPVLLSDTVGFIRNLPHRLIASFKATLEEARKTDLLLHVCDASNPAVLDQISAVFEVLKELDIEEKDTLLVINKIDAVPNRVAIESVLRRYPRGIPVSARTGEGIDRLKVAVSDALSATFRDIEVETHVANGRLLAYLAAHGEILSQTYDDNQVTIHCRIPQKYVGRIREKETVVRDRTSGERLNYKPPEEWELLRAKAAVRPSDDVAVQAESDAAVETQNEHVVGGEELLREVPPTNAKRSDVARNDDSMGDVA
jgi:GTP-binding protein HflX